MRRASGTMCHRWEWRGRCRWLQKSAQLSDSRVGTEGHDSWPLRVAAPNRPATKACATSCFLPRQDADLVVLEFTVNERAEAPMTSPERRSYEQVGRHSGAAHRIVRVERASGCACGACGGAYRWPTDCVCSELAPPHAQHILAQVVRQLLSYPSQPAVVLLHTYAWWEARGDGLDRGLFYHPPEQDLTLFAHVRRHRGCQAVAVVRQCKRSWCVGLCGLGHCSHVHGARCRSTLLYNAAPSPPQYYDLPSLSLRAATWHLQRAGVPRFKASVVLPSALRDGLLRRKHLPLRSCPSFGRHTVAE